MENKITKINITLGHQENPNNTEFTDGIKELLDEQQELGNLTFKTRQIRKCDFCEKELKENDNFISIPQENGNVLDKCEDCEDK